jgi:ADP-heptose:LPS heptosyltransferase
MEKINIICEKNVRNVTAIIRRMNLFISNDTGIMHVAAATPTPVLSLFGETDPLQWAPQRDIDKFILGKDNNIKNITVDKIYELSLKMLKSRTSEVHL